MLRQNCNNSRSKGKARIAFGSPEAYIYYVFQMAGNMASKTIKCLELDIPVIYDI
jgi:hypothetical protein